MKTQESAWNRGDLKGYMDAYWNSDSLIFIGRRGITYGWNNTLKNYRKTYKSTEEMGILLFENNKVELSSRESAMVAGRWNLFRKKDTLSGSYLLVWKVIDGKWKIIADHSS